MAQHPDLRLPPADPDLHGRVRVRDRSGTQRVPSRPRGRGRQGWAGTCARPGIEPSRYRRLARRHLPARRGNRGVARRNALVDRCDSFAAVARAARRPPAHDRARGRGRLRSSPGRGRGSALLVPAASDPLVGARRSQDGAWACRVIAIFLALQAFHIHAGLATATLVVVLSGASTAVPVPVGGGSQQLFATYALRGSVPAAGAMSFSFGVQLGVTALNTAVGIAAAMVLFRTLRPVTALRAARARPI
ncbi:MAG: hypothetical protein E6G28_08265 [Actinobacteria bacterium]|nr:MAG: hypothetical protein E6G28_08265 [Actinomycetota bacterium]